jgi:hypothetical protein
VHDAVTRLDVGLDDGRRVALSGGVAWGAGLGPAPLAEFGVSWCYVMGTVI